MRVRQSPSLPDGRAASHPGRDGAVPRRLRGGRVPGAVGGAGSVGRRGSAGPGGADRAGVRAHRLGPAGGGRLRGEHRPAVPGRAAAVRPGRPLAATQRHDRLRPGPRSAGGADGRARHAHRSSDRAAVRGHRAGGAVRVGPRRHCARSPRRRLSARHGHHDDDLSGRPGRGLRGRRRAGRAVRRPDRDLHRRGDVPGLGRDRRPRGPRPPGPGRSPRPSRTAMQACWQLPGSCSASAPSASRCCSGCCRRPTTCRRPSRCRWPARPAADRSPPAG